MSSLYTHTRHLSILHGGTRPSVARAGSTSLPRPAGDRSPTLRGASAPGLSTASKPARVAGSKQATARRPQACSFLGRGLSFFICTMGQMAERTLGGGWEEAEAAAAWLSLGKRAGNGSYPREGRRPLPRAPWRDGRPQAPRSTESASLPPAPALDSAAAADLTDALCEFDAVLADFASPFHERHFHYEEHLERMKRRSSASVSDSSGFSDSESADSLYRNSFSFSDEKLNSPTDPGPALLSPTVPPRKAKLGDTKELEDFIADLDRTLASEYTPGIKKNQTENSIKKKSNRK